MAPLRVKCKILIWLPKSGSSPCPPLTSPASPSTKSAWAQPLTHPAPTAPLFYPSSMPQDLCTCCAFCLEPSSLCHASLARAGSSLSSHLKPPSFLDVFLEHQLPAPPPVSPHCLPCFIVLCHQLETAHQVTLLCSVSSMGQGLCMPSSLLDLELGLGPGMNEALGWCVSKEDL